MPLLGCLDLRYVVRFVSNLLRKDLLQQMYPVLFNVPGGSREISSIYLRLFGEILPLFFSLSPTTSAHSLFFVL